MSTTGTKYAKENVSSVASAKVIASLEAQDQGSRSLIECESMSCTRSSNDAQITLRDKNATISALLANRQRIEMGKSKVFGGEM